MREGRGKDEGTRERGRKGGKEEGGRRKEGGGRRKEEGKEEGGGHTSWSSPVDFCSRQKPKLR
jgi:hypothetical protein